LSLQQKPFQKDLDIAQMNDIIIDAIQEIKGEHIVKLDLRSLSESPTDYFIICDASSNTQINAIADNIQKRLKNELGILPSHFEGKVEAKWVLLDYFYTVVHVFYPETREFYELEDLWSDAKITEFKSI